MASDYFKAIESALAAIRGQVNEDDLLNDSDKESLKSILSRLKEVARDESSRELPAEARLPSVDTFLVALQKSLSRVSRDSADVGPNQARALIAGSVAFDVSLRCNLEPLSEKLYLTESNEGYSLKLVGSINTDLDIEVYDSAGEEETTASVGETK
ncbi:MAG: hypothetical protein AAFX93_13880 [Verrucomicrobiota bacterium]